MAQATGVSLCRAGTPFNTFILGHVWILSFCNFRRFLMLFRTGQSTTLSGCLVLLVHGLNFSPYPICFHGLKSINAVEQPSSLPGAPEHAPAPSPVPLSSPAPPTSMRSRSAPATQIHSELKLPALDRPIHGQSSPVAGEGPLKRP